MAIRLWGIDVGVVFGNFEIVVDARFYYRYILLIIWAALEFHQTYWALLFGLDNTFAVQTLDGLVNANISLNFFHFIAYYANIDAILGPVSVITTSFIIFLEFNTFIFLINAQEEIAVFDTELELIDALLEAITTGELH